MSLLARPLRGLASRNCEAIKVLAKGEVLILKQKLNFLSLFCEAKRQKRAFLNFNLLGL